MTEKIKKIAIQGRCFANSTTLSLYPNPNDRISVIYGKNGSGKSTISMGLHNLICDSPSPDISLTLLDDDNNLLDSTVYQNTIFVFNEEYIDKNIKIDDDGLGTIILFGGQVDIQREIDQHTALEKQKKEEWEQAQEKLLQYQQKSNPLSPEYHYELIKTELRKSGGWAEIDSKIKGNKTNTPVRDDLLTEIFNLKPVESIDNLRVKFKEKKELLEKISDSSLSFPFLSSPQIHIDNDFEESICHLLSRRIEKPTLTERERLILKTIEDGRQEIVETSKRIFTKDLVSYCPFCYQQIPEHYRQELLTSINRVLNKDVDEHISELEQIVFPYPSDDYSNYDELDHSLVKDITNQIKKYNVAVTKYKEAIEKKIGNIYTPIIINKYGLHEEIELLNSLLTKLTVAIQDFNSATTKRKKIITELVNINKAIAHYDVYKFYINYRAPLKFQNISCQKPPPMV